MKQLLLGFILIFSTYTFAVNDDPENCAHCGTALRGDPSNGLIENQLANLGASKNVSLLARRICILYTKDGTQVAKLVKAAITKHMEKYENTKLPSPAQIIKFLNRNKNYMTCGDDNKNYMMASFEHGRAYDQLFNVLFFDELLVEDESAQIDVNAISYSGPPTGNEPETVLDFMYREYNDKTNSAGKRKEVKSLIETFEEYLGAKRYASLTETERNLVLARR